MMHTFKSTASLVLVAAVAAQVPSGFIPDITTNLMVTFNTSSGTNAVSPPGELLSRADTANPPALALAATSASTASQAVLMMVDVDVPRNNTRVPLLHWLASDVTLAQFTTSNGTQLVTATPPSDGDALIATYQRPSPPPGDIAHRYVLMLFAQPDGFAVPDGFADAIEARVGFNYSAFIDQAGLADAGIAANYMTVRNDTTGAATTTYLSTGAGLPGTATAAPSGNGTITDGPGNATVSTTTTTGGGSEQTSGTAGTSGDAGGQGARVGGGLGAAAGAAVAGVLGMAVML